MARCHHHVAVKLALLYLLTAAAAAAEQEGPPLPQRIKGTSRWRDDEGVEVTLHYEADENGYRAWGSFIPRLDELPPLLRAGIIRNLKVAEQRKARGLDLPPGLKRYREKKARGELPRRRGRRRRRPRRRRRKDKGRDSAADGERVFST